MTSIGNFFLISLIVWVLFSIKFMYDQWQLLKAYQKNINKDFKLSPYTDNFIRNPIAIITERLRIVYGHYPKHPEVDRLAKRVRIEVVIFFALFIVFAASP